MSEKITGVVVLVDENGKEAKFEVIDYIEMDKNEYAILIPLEDPESVDDLETEEIVILKVERDAKGNESYICIDDENLETKVFEEFKKRNEDEYEFDE